MKRIIISLIALCLMLSLTGCERADYVKAVGIYNEGDFIQARQMFLELGEYEDSRDLLKRCDYHLAVQLYKDGKFPEAIQALEKLGQYEDCPALITHSRYQIALQLLESRDYDAAEAALLAMDGYENSEAHIAKLRWDRFVDYILTNGQVQEDGHTYVLRSGDSSSAACIIADTQAPDELQFYTETIHVESFTIKDSLTITITRGQPTGIFTAVSQFTFPWQGKDAGSTQTARGNLVLAQCDAETVLVPQTYVKESIDIYGKEATVTDPAESSMEEGMAVNYASLIIDIPVMVKLSGVDYTMAELGFTAF